MASQDKRRTSEPSPGSASESAAAKKPARAKSAPENSASAQSARPSRANARASRSSRARAPKKPFPKALKTVGRTLRAGGASTVAYTKKVGKAFNVITHRERIDIPVEQGRLRQAARLLPAFMPGILVALILATALITGMSLGNSNVIVDRQAISIAGLPRELEGYSILHIGDLHGRMFGGDQAALLRVIDGEDYDLCLFSGDMVGSGGNPEPFYRLLEGLRSAPQKYFIAGDSDPEPELSTVRDITGTLEQMVLADWVLGAQERGATYLAHTAPIPVSGQALWLSPERALNIHLAETVNQLAEQVTQEKSGVLFGIGVDRNALPLTSYRYNQMLLTQESSADMQPGDLHIALTHFPPSEEFMSVAQQLSQEGTVAYLPPVDLTLSGHYCGGIWKLPSLGALYIPNALYPRHGWFPAQEDVQGLRKMGVGLLYTTAGLGVTDDTFLPKFRFLNAPQVSLITLTAAITENLLGE